jgi:hypothetical protein
MIIPRHVCVLKNMGRMVGKRVVEVKLVEENRQDTGSDVLETLKRMRTWKSGKESESGWQDGHGIRNCKTGRGLANGKENPSVRSACSWQAANASRRDALDAS